MAEAALLHAFAYLGILLGSEESAQLGHLTLYGLGVIHRLRSEHCMAQHIGNLLLCATELHLSQQGALGMGSEAIAVGVGYAIHGAVLDEAALHEAMLGTTQFAFGTSEGTLLTEHIFHLIKTNVVVIVIDKQMAKEQEEQEVFTAKMQLI